MVELVGGASVINGAYPVKFCSHLMDSEMVWTEDFRSVDEVSLALNIFGMDCSMVEQTLFGVCFHTGGG